MKKAEVFRGLVNLDKATRGGCKLEMDDVCIGMIVGCEIEEKMKVLVGFGHCADLDCVCGRGRFETVGSQEFPGSFGFSFEMA